MMSNTLVVEYGHRIDKRLEDFVESSNGTCCIKKEFIDLIYKDYSDAFSTMMVSENVLAKEWLTPEEDKVWGHL